MLRGLLLVAVVGLVAWGYQSIRPPSPKICGSPSGPPVTASRIQLRDGRHLAYKEHGVPRNSAEYKIVFIHPFMTCRHDAVIASNPGFLEEHGIYVVSFDRAGYGQSDPDPKRSVKSVALDVEQLADQLGLGSKFYVVGYSMGGQAVWGVLKYIPHRLAGATLLCPVTNYWWKGFPANLTSKMFERQKTGDKWALRVAHYMPWLLYWWNTQKVFPSSSVVANNRDNFSPQDLKLLHKFAPRKAYQHEVTQQGVQESVIRDMVVGFGHWEFSPMELQNLFPDGKGAVHLWQGDDDRMVPIELQRHIVQTLKWIKYHEIPGAGHLFPVADGMPEAVLKALLFGDHKETS